MNIVIIGVGKVGRTLTEQLSKEEHNIVVIDKNKAVVEKTVNDFDVLGVVGNGANSDIQKEAKIEDADLLIACTASDEINILCCMVGKKLGVTDTIARVRNPEYFKLFMSGELGLNLMVNPEYEGAMEIFRILRSPGAIMIESFAEGKVDLVELKLAENNPMINLSVSQLIEKFNINFLICAIQRGDDVIIPNGNTVLLENDKIYITASPRDIITIFKKAGFRKTALKSVMIIGGGKVAFYLAKELEKIGVGVKIIEKDNAKCLELLSGLNKVEVIEGDGSEQQVLMDEGLKIVDAVVILTGSDEENIMISLFAQKAGAKSIITKINRLSYYSMLMASGVESIISPRLITANQIIRYVRAKQNSKGSAVLNLYKIVNDKAEAVEFIVTDKFQGLSKPLKELEIRKNLLIANILRGNEIILPHGNQTIEKGDKVIVVTTEGYLNDLNDILR
ncbi:MAG: Trk system potassium transporter TrkA [Christensenellales bacterium]|jgi:trk system potassium uptake protein TrkA